MTGPETLGMGGQTPPLIVGSLSPTGFSVLIRAVGSLAAKQPTMFYGLDDRVVGYPRCGCVLPSVRAGRMVG